jgi:hypothetical protein
LLGWTTFQSKDFKFLSYSKTTVCFLAMESSMYSIGDFVLGKREPYFQRVGKVSGIHQPDDGQRKRFKYTILWEDGVFQDVPPDQLWECKKVPENFPPLQPAPEPTHTKVRKVQEVPCAMEIVRKEVDETASFPSQVIPTTIDQATPSHQKRSKRPKKEQKQATLPQDGPNAPNLAPISVTDNPPVEVNDTVWTNKVGVTENIERLPVSNEEYHLKNLRLCVRQQIMA